MTSQATNRREAGFMSYCGHSWKLCTFTWKELETVRAAQKLLGALTIGGGIAQMVVEGVKGVKYAPMPPRMDKNMKKRAVLHTFWLINRQKCCFSLKST
jgi:hypothetical protein